MTNNQLLMSVPAVEPDELAYLQAFTNDLPEDKLKMFISVYNGKRKKAETILVCALLGLVLAAGIQRFVIGQIGMGILYLFTGGLCLVGTIVDIINHKKLAFEYNQKMAVESMAMINGFN
jgi:TM2 domain-containing membrane protein YozV